MLRWLALVAIVGAGCGARTGLDPAGPGADAGIVAADTFVPRPRSCWAEPNCIEADFTASDAAYRETGEVAPTGSALFLNGASVGSLALTIKLMRDARPGVQPYDATDGNVFVFASVADEGCTLFSDIELTRVDAAPGGVTEGTFSGRLIGCDMLDAIREGRFRLTAP